MDYIDRLRKHYTYFQEESVFQKLERVKTLVTELRHQLLEDNKKDCEAVIIRMIRDLQQELTPDMYEQHKATLERPEATPDTDWLMGVEISTDSSTPFLTRLKVYCKKNRFFYSMTSEEEDDGIQMLTATFDEKFSPLAQQLCSAHRIKRDEARELLTIYDDNVSR